MTNKSVMIDLAKVKIVQAQGTDFELLTEMSFAAKGHWNYPDSYYDVWKDELEITKSYIEQNTVYKAQLDNLILGFYSIIENKSDFYSGEIFVGKGFWIEHLFIRPAYHNCGVGRLLIEHARLISKELNIRDLFIFVDPYAAGFYNKIGAEYLYNSKSSIPGRLIPVYILKI